MAQSADRGVERRSRGEPPGRTPDMACRARSFCTRARCGAAQLAGRRFPVRAWSSRFGERRAPHRLASLVPAAAGAVKPRSSCKPG
jgi:hypothetical protein